MSDISQVVAQMVAVGMPPLPPNHPILDGKYKRFGPQKKAWYILREMTLKSGRNVVTGAFGFFQGELRNTVPVTIDFADMSDDDKTELSRKQKEYEAKEAESKQQAAQLAANRAMDQWTKALANPVEHPYLERKQITAEEGVCVGSDGLLLIPMVRNGKLVGLQKIDAAGEKLYNKGMDKIGAACVLGNLDGAPVIGIGEGYATCRSVRLAHDIPVVSAFDAGNILPVARDLRRDYPDAHILFLADDDHLLQQRFIDRLCADFKVSVDVPIDGTTHIVIADDGEQVQATATWHNDPQGVAFIDADVRKGRLIRTLKFQNAGISHCKAAAKAVGNASVVWPMFSDRGLNKWSDWNDLHVEQSLDDVRLQIAAGLAAQAKSPAPSDATADDGAMPPWVDPDPDESVDSDSPDPLGLAAAPEVTGLVSLEWALAHCALVQGSTNVWDSLNKLLVKRPAFVVMVGKDAAKLWESHKERRTISPRNLPKLSRGVATSGGAGDDNLVMMIDRYTLLYGTKTVWDAEKQMVLSYDAMALARSGDLATRWIAHPLHREIDAANLVFDPTQKLSLDTHVNMFQGFPLKPEKDDAKAGLVLALLHSLCSAEPNGDEVFHWVVQWLAYPLQNPGAKMQTGLLFFGEKQGTGKSLFFEGIMRPIYGDHGVTVGQHQLESTFTGWKSQKLYILFEEILSRADKYSHFGLVKHMITGGDTPINEKNLPTRFEANHANTVMLSNEFQAIPLEPDDRRFSVVEARNPLSPDVLAGLTNGDRVADGVSAAFYHYLLNYPLDGFNAHTKPLVTASKQRMIRFGLPGWDAFYQAWSGGELNAPFCSCLATDLYLVYDRWCSRCGERAISQTKFSELLAMRVHKSRQHVVLGITAKKLLTVFKVPSDEDETLSKACQRFRDLADIKDKV